jgi:hypothetical protein
VNARGRSRSRGDHRSEKEVSVDPTKIGSVFVSWLLKPLEALVLLVLAWGVIVGIGITIGLWSMHQAMAFTTPILADIGVAILQVLGPVSDLVLIVGLATALHNMRRGLEIAFGSAIVALVSLHFGGQDWVSAIPAFFHHAPGGR